MRYASDMRFLTSRHFFGRISLYTAFSFIILVSFSFKAEALELTSSSFRISDPVFQATDFSTSTSFQLWGTLSEIAEGFSSSTSFALGSGFLRFPSVSTPVVSATPGTGQVLLSWSASQGFLGWTPTSYTVGQSTVSGGPYSFISVGNVLATTVSSLAAGTPYYFVVLVNDAFGNTIGTSTQVSATPTATVPPPSGGGGGGGGGSSSSASSATFSGRAYPKSSVTLLKDAQVVATTVAGADASFSISASGLTGGSYIFSLYGEDSTGLRSSLISFPVSLSAGATTNVAGIFITPTIAVDKSEVKKGDNIIIFGQSTPSSEITISVNSEEEHFIKKISDKTGVYLLNFDTSVLEMGQHQTRAKTALAGEVSSFSKVIAFTVGTKNVLAATTTKVLKGDLNKDGKVNLVDFSIAAFWYKKQLSVSFQLIETERLNGDKQINLTDFSIIAFNWTG